MLPYALKMVKQQRKRGQRKQRHEFGARQTIETEIYDDHEVVTITSNVFGAGSWISIRSEASGNNDGHARYQVYYWDGPNRKGHKLMDFLGNDPMVNGWLLPHDINSLYYGAQPYFFNGDLLHIWIISQPEKLAAELVCTYETQGTILATGLPAPYTGWVVNYAQQPDLFPNKFNPPPGDFINFSWRVPQLEVRGSDGDHRTAPYAYNMGAFSQGSVPYDPADRVISHHIGRKIATDPYMSSFNADYAERWIDSDSFGDGTGGTFPRYDYNQTGIPGYWLTNRGQPAADYGGIPSPTEGNTANEIFQWYAYRDGASITDSSFFVYNKNTDLYTQITLKDPSILVDAYHTRLLESNAYVGYARAHKSDDVSEATGAPGKKISFYVGNTWGTESILFEFDASIDIPTSAYRYTAGHPGNFDTDDPDDDEFASYFGAYYFTCVRSTPGQRQFLFITRNYGKHLHYNLGYPAICASWHEATDSFEIHYVTPYPKGMIGRFGDSLTPAGRFALHAEDYDGDYAVMLPHTPYNYAWTDTNTLPYILYELWNINIDTGERIDVLKEPFKLPGHLGGGVEFMVADDVNPICGGSAGLQIAP